MNEQVVTMRAGGDALLGVLHLPQEPCDVAVVVVVGGPQYRVGSHRQFLRLARTLAARGHAVLRFDVRGMGDSEGAPRGFEALRDDIGEAIDTVVQQSGARRVVLWGLCDGASASLLYCHDVRDARLAGLCLVNPWVRTDATQARTQVRHYYRQRLAQPAFWRKLLSGRVALSAVTGLWRSLARSWSPPVEAPAYTTRMARAWMAFEGELLLLLSGDDYTAREFLECTASDPAWAGTLARPRLARHTCDRADHTCSDPAAHRWLEQHTLDWLERLAAPPVEAIRPSRALAC